MTGVDIIGALLRAADGAPAGLVAANIKAGQLPDSVKLPALLVRETSSGERQTLRRGSKVRTTDRVSVTVRAGNYRDQGLIIRWVKNFCAGRTGDIAGASSVSILTAGTGPDLIGPATSFEKTQDFRVSYDAPTA